MGSSKKSRGGNRKTSRRSTRKRHFEEAAVGPEEDPKAELHSERRALLWATLAAMLGFFLWIICIGTEQWVTVTAPGTGPVYVNRTKTFFLYANMGLFRMCRTSAPAMPNGLPGVEESSCFFFSVFPSEHDIRHNVEIDRTILEYTRSEVAFCTLSMAMLLMGIGFSVYTFKEHRYMFKRLAGGVHFISGWYSGSLRSCWRSANGVSREKEKQTARAISALLPFPTFMKALEDTRPRGGRFCFCPDRFWCQDVDASET